MKKTIKDLNISIEDTWCEVTNKEGEFMCEFLIDEGISHEDVYKKLTAKYEYSLNGKVLASLSMHGSCIGEKEAVIERLAYENNCSIDNIKVRIVTENI